MVKAISLFSGSLASIVATELVAKEEGVDELAIITFRSPFFEDYTRIKEEAARLWPEINFRSQSVKKKVEKLSNISPETSVEDNISCLGCRELILERGRRFMERMGGDFLVTGEILNRRNGLGESELLKTDENAGVSDLVYRPLSSNFLQDTVSEENGWVENGFSMRGESEEELKHLKDELALDVPSEGFPAEERCKLTSFRYRKRLKDLLQESQFTTNALKLLEFDDYFKIPPDVKVVFGKTEEEKRELQNYFLPSDLRIYLPSHEGPMSLVRSAWDEKDEGTVEEVINFAARAAVLLSQAGDNCKIPVNYRFENDSETFRLDVFPLKKRDLETYRIEPTPSEN